MAESFVDMKMLNAVQLLLRMRGMVKTATNQNGDCQNGKGLYMASDSLLGRPER